jgi:hypothetical protein
MFGIGVLQGKFNNHGESWVYIIKYRVNLDRSIVIIQVRQQTPPNTTNFTILTRKY